MLWANLAGAQVVRAFSSRFSVNQSGDIRIVGNTVQTCSTTGVNGGICLAARAGGNNNNNDFTMIMVDVDGVGATFNSSSADLDLPAGATPLFAGLYWGADASAGVGGVAAPNAALRNQVLFTRPDGSSSTITATQVDVSGTTFQGFADVTALVQANGAGSYTVANLQAGTGTNHYAGWSLVVAYEDPTEPIRNLTVNDGFAVVSGGNPNVSTTIGGFLTPATGQVRSRLGAVVYEGDLSSTGDALRLNGTALSDALNPVANPFNSSIGRLGVRATAKSPDFVNQLGFDIDVVDATGILGNSVNTATMSFATGGETFSILGRRLHRQVGWLLALEDTVNVAGSEPILVAEVRPVGDQTTVERCEARDVDRGQFVAGRCCNDHRPMNSRQWPRGHDHCVVGRADERGNRLFDVGPVEKVERHKLDPQGRCDCLQSGELGDRRGEARLPQHRHARDARRDLFEQLKPFCC